MSSKDLYCSECGICLTHYLQAVKNKGIIIHLVEPHECSGKMEKSQGDQRPTVLDITNISDLEEAKKVVPETPSPVPSTDLFKDLRANVKTTGTPKGILETFKNLNPTESAGLDSSDFDM